MNHSLSLLIFGLFLISVNACAQSGTNDPSFNPPDIGFGNGDGFNGRVNSYAIQTDGKIIAGGSFSQYNEYACGHVVRLLPNGKVDSSFHAPVTGAFVEKVLLLNDGKILVGGVFNPINGSGLSGLVRLNQDGSIDNSFNTGGSGTDGVVRSIAIQSNGKIIIAGDFILYNGVSQHFLSRLNSDGTLDPSFNPGTGFEQFSTSQRTLAVQTDDKILIGGIFSSYDGNPVNYIVRLNSDGSYDNTFNVSGSGPNGKVESIALQADSKIVIGGLFTAYNGTALPSRLAQLNSDGTLDISFNPNITISGGKIYSVAVQNDGKVLAGQGFVDGNSANRVRLLRLNTDGSTDNTFTTGLEIIPPPAQGVPVYINTISVQNDGKILVGGHFINYNYTPANYGLRLNTDGTVDPDFNTGTGASGYIRAINLQTDGKILIGGDFTAYNGVNSGRIARLHSNGSLDLAFDAGLGPNAEVRSIACQADGKVIIGGGFTMFNSFQSNRTARLNTDGTLDNSFNIGSGANNGINIVAVQTDGKVIVGGNFTTFNGASKLRIVRLNADGSIDNTFNIGSGFNDEVYDIELQTDGKIVVVGEFTYYNGSLTMRAVRLNQDGSKDLSFNPQNGANYIIHSVDLQNDGKIVIGGGFTTYNNIPTGNLARINSDGTLDNTFVTGSGASGYIHTLEAVNDGKVLIGGYFTAYNGNPCNYITKINADGTIDNTFNSGTGANDYVHTLAIQTDGKILFGGKFTGYDTIGRNRIARLLNCISVDLSSSVTNTTCFNGNDGAIEIAPSGGVSPYSYNWNNGSVTEDISELTPGNYSVTITDAYGCSTIDSFVVTQPNVLQSTLSETTCGPYIWGHTGLTYTSSGIYSDTIQNAVGCDSIVTLILTIHNSSEGIDVQTSCDPFTWIDGNTYSVSTNTPTFTLANAQGCDSTITLNLSIVSPPNAQVTDNGSGILTATGGTVTAWINCSNSSVIGGQTANTFTPTANGTYAAVVYDGLSTCSDTSNCILVNNISLSENQQDNLQLYPNPTNDLVTISFEGTSAHYTIYDAQGKLIQTSTIISGEAISLSDVQTGVYFFELTTEHGSIVKRIVKN
jgi:uncharacterized delta-60 repeat protein